MTKEQIVELAVKNNLVEEVYDTLHQMIMRGFSDLQDRLDETNTELRIIKKLASGSRIDANRLKAIKAILSEEE